MGTFSVVTGSGGNPPDQGEQRKRAWLAPRPASSSGPIRSGNEAYCCGACGATWGMFSAQAFGSKKLKGTVLAVVASGIV